MAAKTATVLQTGDTSATITFSEKPIGIRVSPNSYFIALFLAAFLSGLLVYLEYERAAIVVFGVSWIVFPLLAWNDSIVFDGKKLLRTGLIPRLWTKLNRSKNRIKIADIEQVETQSLRALKRGGNVFYRYRTTVSGKGARVAFASGGEDYRRMIHRVFPLVPENILDNRSLELRDYLSDPKETLTKAEFARIPSVEVLENFFGKSKTADKKRRRAGQIARTSETEESEKVDYLHRLANELRLSGYLLQSLEAFRRALFLNSKDTRLLFDFARCLHSYAGAERDKNLTRKSFAALRLAERRAAGDTELLARLGECYFQYGDWARARRAFEKSAAAPDEQNFRAVRGLAEIALREGKIAHVIHQFTTANRLVKSAALRRWTKNETDYFSRLNSDEDYMEMEISRVKTLENLERAKKTCLQIALLSFPAIVIGVAMQEATMANLGWSISSLALIVWLGVIFAANIFARRIPLDFENEE